MGPYRIISGHYLNSEESYGQERGKLSGNWLETGSMALGLRM